MKKLILIIFLSAFAYSQNPGIIFGYVQDAETGNPLPYATVYIKGTKMGSITDKNGFYEIRNVPPGVYLVGVRYVGYKEQVRQVEVKAGKRTRLDFGLVTEAIKLGEVTVEAKTSSISAIRTLEAKDIAKFSVNTVAEALEEVPGIAISRAGGWGVKPYLQGVTDSRVLVFIDGVKVNQACPMGMDACTATIEPDLIDEVKVQLGSGSVTYGSGNIGGVINITTRSYRDISSQRFKFNLDAGTRYESVSNSKVGSFALSGGNRKFDFYAGVVVSDHGDYSSAKEVVKNSGFKSKNLHIKLRYRPSYREQLSFTTQLYRASDIGWPASNTLIPAERRNTYALNYFLTDIGKKLKSIRLHISYQPMYHNMINLIMGEKVNGSSISETYNLYFDSYWSVGLRNRLTAGFSYSLWRMNARQSGGSYALIDILPDARLGEFGVYVEDKYNLFSNLNLQFGLRGNYVRSSARGGVSAKDFVLTGSVGLVYKPVVGTELRVTVNRGFKSPTPVERYLKAPMVDGYYRIGEPKLQPEINLSKKLEFSSMKGKFNWGVELYHNNLSNFISAVVDPSLKSPFAGLRGVKKFTNIHSVVITGGSAFLNIAFSSSVYFSSSVSYDWGVDRETNEPVPGIAPLRFNFKLSYERKNYWFNVSGLISAPQNRFAKRYGEIRTPGYAVFDLAGGLKLGKTVEISVGVKNILNKYYRNHLNPSLLPEPGRNIYASIKVSLPVTYKRKLKLHNLSEVKLGIEGMACQFCAKTVKERLISVDGVVSADVKLESKKATVVFDSGKVGTVELINAVERAGYKAKVIEVKKVKK